MWLQRSLTNERAPRRTARRTYSHGPLVNFRNTRISLSSGLCVAFGLLLNYGVVSLSFTVPRLLRARRTNNPFCRKIWRWAGFAVKHTAQPVRCLTFQTFLPILLLLDQDWESKWVASTSKGSQAGKFKWSAGKFYGDPDKDKGIVGLGLQDYYWSDRFSLL